MKGYFRRRGSSWSFTLDIGKDNEGNRKQKTKGGFKTKKEAEQACAELIHQMTKEGYVEPSQSTLKDYLREWLHSTAKQTLKRNTFETYEIVMNTHLVPELGKMKLNQLKPSHIQNFYMQKIEEGLSPEYVRYMHTILNTSLNQAVKWQLISKNPVSLVQPPRLRSKEQQTWTIEEANQFLDATKEEKLHLAYMLAIYTGMRMGEILGLRWKDCNLDSGMLSIQQTLVRTKEEGLIFQEPKTKGSKRVVAITEEVGALFKKHKAEQNKVKLLLGTAYQDHDLVICTKKGTPISPRNLQRHFARMVHKADVPKIRFHDTRHTHATIMLQLGEHPKVVSERLGHSRISITLDTYSHVIPHMQEDAAKKFSEALSKMRLETTS
jgi:integrase